MLDFSFLPENTLAKTETFGANSVASGVTWGVWQKRRGVSMVHMIMWAGGGGGGSGAVGAASTAGGGGGGSSSTQVSLLIPAWYLPDVLYYSIGVGGAPGAAGINSYVSIVPNSAANSILATATPGNAGSNASAGSGGAAGTAPTNPTASNMPLGFSFITQLIVGVAGVIGGAAIAGAALTLPVTGLLVTGGTGGGGLPAVSTAGSAGGAFTIVANSQFPVNPGGVGGAASNAPGGTGNNGIQLYPTMLYFYGGTGGGSGGLSSAGSSAAAGGIGGKGAIGSGGGGGGGGFTGATAAVGGSGGNGSLIITSW